MPESEVILSRGSQGAEVARLQTMLGILGYYKRDVSGEYDLYTEHAVKSLQADAHLPITGAVDQITHHVLGQVISDLTLSGLNLRVSRIQISVPWWALVAVAGGATVGLVELVKLLGGKK